MKGRELRAEARIAVKEKGVLKKGEAAAALLDTGDGWFPCMIQDMSDSGFLIFCSKPLAVGQVLDFKCALFPDRTLECKIEVRHVGNHGMGAKIVNVDSRGTRLIELYFTEPLESGFSSIRLIDSLGGEIPISPAVVDPADPTRMTSDLSLLGPGVYTVAYRSLSQVDGHEWASSFPFTVLNPDGSRPEGGAAAIPDEGMGELPNPAEVASALRRLWLEEGLTYREYAAEFVGRYYFNQPPALLKWALTRPLDRVMYAPLSPRKPDFDLVVDLMVESAVLDHKIAFGEYVDTRFAEGAQHQTAWSFEPGEIY
jgi:hypothetical protein